VRHTHFVVGTCGGGRWGSGERDDDGGDSPRTKLLYQSTNCIFCYAEVI